MFWKTDEWSFGFGEAKKLKPIRSRPTPNSAKCRILWKDEKTNWDLGRLPTNRIALPGLSHEQNYLQEQICYLQFCSSGNPSTVILFVGELRQTGSVRGEAQVEQFCSWGSPGRANLFVGKPRENHSVRGEACIWWKKEKHTPREARGKNRF